MVFGQGDVQAVVEEVDVLEGLARQVLDHRERVDKGKVEIPRREKAYCLIWVELNEVSLNTTMPLGERLYGARYKHRAGSRKGAKAQAPDLQADERSQLLLGGAYLAKNLVRVAYQNAAGISEYGATSTALNKADAHFSFERRDLLRYGGRCVSKRGCRRRQRTPSRDLTQHLQSPDVEHEDELTR